MQQGMTAKWGRWKGAVCGFFLVLLCPQNPKAQDTLHSPLALPLQFSGNFGEIRTGHFHTGLDIRTEGKEGVPVLAAQDGKIGRIKVSDRGYGRALYLNGGGLTTVYAHLSSFHPDIEAWLQEAQYAKESWLFDGPPDQDFSFAMGDTIGWSGNSGRSFGPHLHFEVRDQRNQWPINPLHWAMKGQGVTQDDVPPEFRGVWVMPLDGAEVEGEAKRFRWSPAYGESAKVAGPFRLGVEAFDRMDGEPFSHGPYGMDVWFDGELVHSHRMDTLDFSTNGDVVAHVDLAAWQDRRSRVHRLHRLPGNRLDIYAQVNSMSPFEVAPGDTAILEVVVLDMAGNQTQVEMALLGDSLPKSGEAMRPVALDRNRRHRVTGGRAAVELPPGVLYADAVVTVQDDSTGRFAVECEARVTRSDYTLSVPVPADFVGSGDALVLCALDEKDEVDGTWVSDERGGYMSVKLDRFGIFEVRSDTLSPVIGKPQVASGKLSMKVSDDLSGVKRWEGRCGDQWIRLAFEKGVLWHPVEDGILEAGQEVKVWAVDASGNLGHRTFTWPIK